MALHAAIGQEISLMLHNSTGWPSSCLPRGGLTGTSGRLSLPLPRLSSTSALPRQSGHLVLRSSGRVACSLGDAGPSRVAVWHQPAPAGGEGKRGSVECNATAPSRPAVAKERVCDAMNKSPITVSSDATVQEMMVLLVENRISGVCVIDENRKVLGFVSNYDLLALDATPGLLQPTTMFPSLDMPWKSFQELQEKLRQSGGTTAGDIMTKELVSVSAHETLDRAASMMLSRRMQRVVVTDPEGTLLGILSRTDVLRSTLEAMGYAPKTTERRA